MNIFRSFFILLFLTVWGVGCSEENKINAPSTNPDSDPDSAQDPPLVPQPSTPPAYEVPTVAAPPTPMWGSCPEDVINKGRGQGYTGPAAQCTTLRVPLNYGAADSGALDGEGYIDLFIARISARQPSQRLGVLMTDFGGPGTPNASSGNHYSVWRSTPDVIRDRFDIVTWDTRGTGRIFCLVCRPT